jgi:hypothetical protein
MGTVDAFEVKGQQTPVSDTWRPKLDKHVPVLSLAALFGVLLFAGLSVCILVLSNDQVVGKWPHAGASIQPTVFLSLFSSISGLLLGFAISRGTTISWWQQAPRGASVKDLSRSWDMAHSVWTAATLSHLRIGLQGKHGAGRPRCI